MTKKNPDDSVLEEQSEALDDASGTEDTTKAEEAEEFEPAADEAGEVKNKIEKENRGLNQKAEEEKNRETSQAKQSIV